MKRKYVITINGTNPSIYIKATYYIEIELSTASIAS